MKLRVVEKVLVLCGNVCVDHFVVVVFFMSVVLVGVIVAVGVIVCVTVLVKYWVVDFVVVPPEPCEGFNAVRHTCCEYVLTLSAATEAASSAEAMSDNSILTCFSLLEGVQRDCVRSR